MRRGDAAMLALLLTAGMLLPTRADSVILARDAVGAAGALLDGPGVRLGFTVGLPAVGVSTAPGVSHLAGFWRPRIDVSTSAEEWTAIPRVTVLGRSQPNPFRESTQFELQLAGTAGARSPVTLEIFDLSGRRVRRLIDGPLVPGVHRVTWDGRDDARHLLPTGVYFARFAAADRRMTRKLVLTR